MNNIVKYPLWVRVYARKEQKNILSQLAGAVAGVLGVIGLEYLLNDRDMSSILIQDQIIKYSTILFVFVYHIFMVQAATKWVNSNTTGVSKDRYLSKWYSYSIALFILIAVVLLKNLLMS